MATKDPVQKFDFWAFPCHPEGMGKPWDGAEKCGMNGLLRGQYASDLNFIKFWLEKKAEPFTTYNIYIRPENPTGWDNWIFQKKWRKS